jgi:hypothetical protein
MLLKLSKTGFRVCLFKVDNLFNTINIPGPAVPELEKIVIPLIMILENPPKIEIHQGLYRFDDGKSCLVYEVSVNGEVIGYPRTFQELTDFLNNLELRESDTPLVVPENN